MMKSTSRFVRTLLSLTLALSLLLSLSVTGLASGYTIDLASMTDQQMEDAQVAINVVLKGKDPVRIEGDAYYGYPVRVHVPAMDGHVTWVPIRLICNAIGVSVAWQGAKIHDPAHAAINVPKHGFVNLYPGVTSIIAKDGTTYSETTYTFPDGSPIPLCLNRSGRIYVPVRFISSFLVDDAEFVWSEDETTLTIMGGQSDPTEWDGFGVYEELRIDSNDLFAHLPNTRTVSEQAGLLSSSKTGGAGTTLTVAGATLRRVSTGLIIEDFAFSHKDATRYQVTTAMIRDILDDASENAFLLWLDGLDALWTQAAQAQADGNQALYRSTMAAIDAYAIPVYETSYARFGNVDVQWLRDGTSHNIHFVNIARTEGW